MELLIIIAIGLPLLGALAAGVSNARRAAGISVLAVLIAAAVAAFVGIGSFPTRFDLRLATLPWLPGLGEPGLFGVLLDPLSLIMLLVVLVIGFFVVLYSTEYMSPRNRDHPAEEGNPRYFFWLLLFVGAMAGVALSPNLLQLYIFWELTTICSWALISHTYERDALHAGYKALIMTHVGGVAFLSAIVVVYTSTGSVEFGAISELSPALATTVFVLFLAAAWAKASQVPFHTWLPEAMTAPTPISCYLHAAAMVKAGVYLVARLVLANGQLPATGGVVGVIAALVTMSVAVFLYFFQDDLKRLLALSTIANLSYIILAASLGVLGSTVAYRGAALHIANHACAKGLLFLCVGAMAYVTGRKKISELSGLGSKMPLVATCFMVGLLGVVGVPPLANFWSKFYIITGALSLPGALGPFVGAFLLAESMVAFGWFLYVGQRVLFGETSSAAETATDPPWQMSVSLVVLAVLVAIVPAGAIAVVSYLP